MQISVVTLLGAILALLAIPFAGVLAGKKARGAGGKIRISQRRGSAVLRHGRLLCALLRRDPLEMLCKSKTGLP